MNSKFLACCCRPLYAGNPKLWQPAVSAPGCAAGGQRLWMQARHYAEGHDMTYLKTGEDKDLGLAGPKDQAVDKIYNVQQYFEMSTQRPGRNFMGDMFPRPYKGAVDAKPMHEVYIPRRHEISPEASERQKEYEASLANVRYVKFSDANYASGEPPYMESNVYEPTDVEMAPGSLHAEYIRRS